MEEQKRRAGEAAAGYVSPGMTVGLGTGSTVRYTILKLGERVRSGLSLRAVPTSEATAALARQVGIGLVTLADIPVLDLAIDGADEVDPQLNLIKGGGGALLREKLVALAARRLVIVVDETKRVPALGARPVPVAVVPFAWKQTQRRIEALGGAAALRGGDGGPFRTDDGLFVLDCTFSRPFDPPRLHAELKALCGVVETGLFPDLAETVLVAGPGRVEALRRAEV